MCAGMRLIVVGEDCSRILLEKQFRLKYISALINNISEKMITDEKCNQGGNYSWEMCWPELAI